MADYLVTLSLGPVQSLIGAARRTRDLWSGSWLLSELSRAAALAFYAAAPDGLIFPAPTQPKIELQPQSRPGDSANIANILRVQVSAADTAAVRALCEIAKAAAQERLQQLGEEAKRDLRGLGEPAWQAQIGDLLESFAAWVEIGEGGYAAASQRLSGVLAARKATRDFGVAALGSGGLGVPKSSLDGAFESVLPDKSDRHYRDLARKLQLSAGEQLDALGVVKRRGGDVDQFTAYSRIAADPWLQRLTSEQRQRLADGYEPLVGLELATRVRGNQGIYSDFPYDAQLLFDFRLHNLLENYRHDAEAAPLLEALSKTLKAITQEPNAEGKPAGNPVPYAVILQADGDRMGELLNRATTAAQSRAISQALQRFADSVRAWVRQHRGHAIYAGGDDVLALLPLPSAVACSRALATTFAEQMGGIAEELGVPADSKPSLSVGLGIGHLVEPLGMLRDRALRAEKAAKGDRLSETERRNALALILGVRSGGETHWRAQWSDQTSLNELTKMVQAYEKHELSSRVAYDLRAIDRRLAWLKDRPENATHRGMRQAEVARMLDRARQQGGSEKISDDWQKKILQRCAAVSLATLADTLITARWLAAKHGHELERG